MDCLYCANGKIIRYTKEERRREKKELPNIGKCNKCGTKFTMHKTSGKIFALIVYEATKQIMGTKKSLKLYQEIALWNARGYEKTKSPSLFQINKVSI